MNNGSAMKKVVLILIIVMFCSIAAAAVLFIADGGKDNFLSDFGGYNVEASGNTTAANNEKVDEEKQESISGIEYINVSDISENIKFIPVDTGDTIKAHFYGNFSSSNKNYRPTLIVSKSGNTVDIKIKYPQNKLVINFRNDFKLDIYIPKTYAENLKVATTSANTSIDEMNLKSFKYSTISGDLTANSVNSAKTELHATSGKSKINGSLGDFTFTSISGELVSDNFKAEAARIEVTSADVSLKGNPGETTYKSISGGIKLDYTEKISGGINANVTSGNINLKLPSDSEFGIEFRATSGNAKCDFPVTLNGSQDDNRLNGTVGSSSNMIKVSSISGDLSIEKK